MQNKIGCGLLRSHKHLWRQYRATRAPSCTSKNKRRRAELDLVHHVTLTVVAYVMRSHSKSNSFVYLTPAACKCKAWPAAPTQRATALLFAQDMQCVCKSFFEHVSNMKLDAQLCYCSTIDALTGTNLQRQLHQNGIQKCAVILPELVVDTALRTFGLPND